MFKCLIITSIALCSSLSANESPSLDQKPIYQQIIENEPGAILFVTEDKVYLDHEKIHISSQGIFVGNVPVPSLYSDGGGCWMSRPSNYWICRNPECLNYQKVYISHSSKCPICRWEGDPG